MGVALFIGGKEADPSFLIWLSLVLPLSPLIGLSCNTRHGHVHEGGAVLLLFLAALRYCRGDLSLGGGGRPECFHPPFVGTFLIFVTFYKNFLCKIQQKKSL